LLLAVLAGVLTMHTLNHPANHSAPGTGNGGHATMVVVAELMSADESGMDIAGPGQQAPSPSPTDPTSLCVAILCATLLFAWTLALLHRRGAIPLRPEDIHALFAAARGPPALAIGLRLADLSVLRN
jgi:Family of unknown function (DUF6153)